MAELNSQPTSIQSVYAQYREDKLYVNRRYQRKLVWTLEEKQRLIESVLHRYPMPAILLAEKSGDAGTYEIIDGLQRLHAIVSFIETAFPTLDAKLFDLQQFPNAKSRADEGLFQPNEGDAYLSQREISTILDYTLAVSVMRNATEDEINDVFGRINTYGHRLSDQERRQAGVTDDFSELIRGIACTLRGDATSDMLLLKSMPSISIDLPKTKHGYEVQADEVFWVTQGILRATDLRDSMDEQCIADISACIVGGNLIERSKDVLDKTYTAGSAESDRINNALDVYGSTRFAEQFKYCVDEIIKICAVNGEEKLRDIIFRKRTTNPFPSVFATLLIALHELVFAENKIAADYAAIKKALENLDDRIETGRKSTSVDERRKNIDTVKGLIGQGFVARTADLKIYGNHAITDIEVAIRRSEIELSDYELKQGMLKLDDGRQVDANIHAKVVATICAIANNGPNRIGKVIIGVSDRNEHTERIVQLDNVKPKKVGKRSVVGIIREAKVLGISPEQYVSQWRDAISNSGLSEPLKTHVLSHIDFNSFYGLGVIVITIPPQNELSYVGDDVYWRNADSTEKAINQKQAAEFAKRFLAGAPSNS